MTMSNGLLALAVALLQLPWVGAFEPDDNCPDRIEDVQTPGLDINQINEPGASGERCLRVFAIVDWLCLTLTRYFRLS